MKETKKVIKHYSTQEKITVILNILKNIAYGKPIDISSDSKTYSFLKKFTNASCNIEYNKVKDIIWDARQTYKIYTSENLWKFVTLPEVIEMIVNNEEYKSLSFIFNKKYVRSLDNEDWVKVEYIPTIDNEAEKFDKLNKEYSEFVKSLNFYKIRPYNPNAKYNRDFATIIVYDNTNKKNINLIWEFPAEVFYKDTQTYMNMCKVHWCKENKFNLSEKFKDARVMSTAKYEEMLNN